MTWIRSKLATGSGAIESVIREEGVERAQYLIDQLLAEARKGGVNVAAGTGISNYINTIPR